MAKNTYVQDAYDATLASASVNMPNLNEIFHDEPEASIETELEQAVDGEPEPGRERVLSDASATVNLFEDQRARIDIIRRSTGVKQVDIIREGVDLWLEQHGWTERIDDAAVAEYAATLARLAAL